MKKFIISDHSYDPPLYFQGLRGWSPDVTTARIFLSRTAARDHARELKKEINLNIQDISDDHTATSR